MGILRHCIVFLIVSGVLFFPCTAPADNGAENLYEGFVYFSDADKTALKSVRKKFPSGLDDHGMGVEIVKTIIEGPSDARLKPLWPEATKINALFITDDGSAYVDLEPPLSFEQNMDASTELLSVNSLVNSLTLNIPKIRQVKVLINGKDARTLAGHISLEHFFKTNMLIVK